VQPRSAEDEKRVSSEVTNVMWRDYFIIEGLLGLRMINLKERETVY
jgi:hypothetical protein